MSTLVFDDKQRIGSWVADKVGQTCSWGDFYAMGIVDSNNELTAGVVFNNFNGSNATCHIAITKPSRTFIQLMRHAANYAFNQCGLKRLTGLVDVSNEKAMLLDQHLGWEKEFVMKHAASDGGDLQVFVMWPDKCKWLRGEE